MAHTHGRAALRLLAVLALMLVGVVPAAMAGGDHYSEPSQPTVVYVNQSSNCCYSHPAYYHNGSSAGTYNWSGATDTTTGYTGSFGPDNLPHRGDWLAKLQAQRQWDEKQYAKMNGDGGAGAACGFTNSPAYCYKLMGPYPSELKIVRY